MGGLFYFALGRSVGQAARPLMLLMTFRLLGSGEACASPRDRAAGTEFVRWHGAPSARHSVQFI